jgi:YegS/Rv2252/BmrU family lipid kinase
VCGQYPCAVPAPVFVIVNPAAGGGRAGRVAGEVIATLATHGLRARRADAEHAGHAAALAREAALAGDTVAVLGGDGLIGVVADALRDVPGAVLGILPAGRGNDLARVLHIPRDPLDACATIAAGATARMDVGELSHGAAHRDSAGRRTFVGIASAGFDSDANRIANEAPAWLGRLVYFYGALRALLSWRAARFEIVLEPEGRRYAFVGYSVCVANSRAYGGGMRMAPDALLDDGLLDIVAMEHVGRLRFLTNLRVFRGTHVRQRTVSVFRAAQVEISADRPFALYADGDPLATLPVRLRAVAAAINVLVPAAAEGLRAERGTASPGFARVPSRAEDASSASAQPAPSAHGD